MGRFLGILFLCISAVSQASFSLYQCRFLGAFFPVPIIEIILLFVFRKVVALLLKDHSIEYIAPDQPSKTKSEIYMYSVIKFFFKNVCIALFHFILFNKVKWNFRNIVTKKKPAQVKDFDYPKGTVYVQNQWQIKTFEFLYTVQQFIQYLCNVCMYIYTYIYIINILFYFVVFIKGDIDGNIHRKRQWQQCVMMVDSQNASDNLIQDI